LVKVALINCLQYNQSSLVFTVLKRSQHVTCSTAVEGMCTIAAAEMRDRARSNENIEVVGAHTQARTAIRVRTQICAHNL